MAGARRPRCLISEPNFILRNTSRETFQNVSDVIRVPRNGETKLAVRMGEVTDRVDLSFQVLNTQVGFRKSLELALSAPVAPSAAVPLAR